jgi:hypothetical protein
LCVADTKLKSKRAKEEKFSADVISTAGVEFVEVPLGKKDRIVFRVNSFSLPNFLN